MPIFLLNSFHSQHHRRYDHDWGLLVPLEKSMSLISMNPETHLVILASWLVIGINYEILVLVFKVIYGLSIYDSSIGSSYYISKLTIFYSIIFYQKHVTLLFFRLISFHFKL